MMEVAYFQMVGQGKARNQDALFAGVEVKFAKLNKARLVEVPSSGFCLAVADGVSNSPSSHLASRFWLQKIAETPLDKIGARDFFERNFEQFCEEISPVAYGSSTTLAGVVIDECGACRFFNIGDSRIYLIDNAGKFTQLSHDHTVLNDMIAEGLAKPDGNYASMYNALSQCLIADSEEYDFSVYRAKCTLKPGESLLLCTDGFTNELDDETLSKLWQCGDGLCEKLETLRQAVKACVGYDDCSVVVASWA